MNRVEHRFDADGDPVTNIWLDGLHSRINGHWSASQAFSIIRQYRMIAATVKYNS